jgi:deoxyadenosine/deoxycytidine kinase
MTEFKLISIDGNIGSGKSTLMANLREHYKDEPNVVFLKEPVDEWAAIKDENGITILEKFYEDSEKYAFSFQMMAYISRLKVLKDLKHLNL